MTAKVLPMPKRLWPHGAPRRKPTHFGPAVHTAPPPRHQVLDCIAEIFGDDIKEHVRKAREMRRAGVKQTVVHLRAKRS